MTSRESDKVMLRLPDGMRNRIKAAAAANKRSMNAEILSLLDQAFPEPVDDAAAMEMLQYMLAAPPEDLESRKAEIQAKLTAMKSGARVYDGPALPGGKVAIIKPYRPKD
jgi:plasmid stability protein